MCEGGEQGSKGWRDGDNERALLGREENTCGCTVYVCELLKKAFVVTKGEELYCVKMKNLHHCLHFRFLRPNCQSKKSFKFPLLIYNTSPP